MPMAPMMRKVAQLLRFFLVTVPKTLIAPKVPAVSRKALPMEADV